LVLSALFAFQLALFCSQVKSVSYNPQKSGSIINKVGKSVNLLAISSICLVTQYIKNEGKEEILF
jgi:hypothetical protein